MWEKSFIHCREALQAMIPSFLFSGVCWSAVFVLLTFFWTQPTNDVSLTSFLTLIYNIDGQKIDISVSISFFTALIFSSSE